MSSYRRFVTYLFEYQDGTKGKNCGFSKVEIRGGEGRIQIQVKGIADADYEVYLFVPDEDGIAGISIGRLPVRSQSGNITLPVNANAVGGTDRDMDEIRGMYLTAEADTFIASQWGDEEISWGRFSEYVPAVDGRSQEDVPTEDGRSHEGVPVVDERSYDAGDDDPLPGRGLHPGEAAKQSESDRPSETRNGKTVAMQRRPQPNSAEMQATQTAAARQPVPYPNVWEQQWQNFLAKHPSFTPFDAEPDIRAVKMDLRDLRILPKRYQSLVNNSFLLHGYFNYKYILFGCEEGETRRWFIGVPGSFQNQEQLLAGLFGFPEFRTKHQTKQRTGEFGYWYRFLQM